MHIQMQGVLENTSVVCMCPGVGGLTMSLFYVIALTSKN